MTTPPPVFITIIKTNGTYYFNSIKGKEGRTEAAVWVDFQVSTSES